MEKYCSETLYQLTIEPPQSINIICLSKSGRNDEVCECDLFSLNFRHRRRSNETLHRHHWNEKHSKLLQHMRAQQSVCVHICFIKDVFSCINIIIV